MTTNHHNNCDFLENKNGMCESLKVNITPLHRSKLKMEKTLLDFDSAVQLTGYGCFHYRLVAVCALCLLTNGLQNGLSSYIFPAAQCDLCLTSAQIGYLNVAFLVGGVCSSFLWGSIADLVGRRRVLLYTLLISSACTLISALQQQFLGLCIFRFFNGFLTGAAGSITFNYVSEFHAPQHRSKSVCYSGVFYTSAWLLLPILSFAILPLPASRLGGVSAWRFFLAIVAVPEIIAGVFLIYLPESPKYVVQKNKEEALGILRYMYSINGNKREEFPVKRLEVTVVDEEEVFDEEDEVVCSAKVKRFLRKMIMQVRRIFKGHLVFKTALISLIMFCNMFGYFGLGLWLPELFIRFQQFEEQYPNKSASIQYLATMNFTKNSTCVPEFNINLFKTTLSIGLSSLFGNLVAGWLSGTLSLKVIPFVTMLIGGLSSGSIYWLNASWQNLAIACIFQTVMATVNIALGGVVVELFPTKVAGIALCLTLFVGRVSGMLSNLMFGLLMDKQPVVPIFTVSAVLLLGSVFCCFIPNSQNGAVETTEKNKKLENSLTKVIGKQSISVAVINTNDKIV